MTLSAVLAVLVTTARATSHGGESFKVSDTLDEREHLGAQFFPEEEDEFADENEDYLRTDRIRCTVLFHLSAGNAGAQAALRDAMDAEQTLRTALVQAPGLAEVRPRIPGRIRRRKLPGASQWLESEFYLTTSYREVPG